ncbi:MAG: protein kinase [Deltaproteobacteria bacterium]|nr:protein kinase [Deltaproteobacteria bacterium]
MTTPAAALPAGTILGERYELLRVIGRGAMGTVYEARHLVLGRRLAVKVLNPDAGTATLRERFFHEARAAGAITHEHIVQVHDFGLVEGSDQPYLVMEYVDGETLDAYLQREAPVPPEDAVELGAQVLSALALVHGAGLMHRDIKPANIMLARGRRPRLFAKLLDFGIARALHGDWHRPDLTRVDQVLGTPAYLSPEQAAGGPVDARWDLWAVATIMYELLSGELPFRLESMQQVAEDIANCRLIPLRQRRPELPAWLLEVLERAHHPAMGMRYPNATSFLQALELKRAGGPGEADWGTLTTPFMRVTSLPPPAELMSRLSATSPRRAPESPKPASAGPSAVELRPANETRGRQASSAGTWEDLNTSPEGLYPATREASGSLDDLQDADERTRAVPRLAGPAASSPPKARRGPPVPEELRLEPETSSEDVPLPSMSVTRNPRGLATAAGQQRTWLVVGLAALLLVAATTILVLVLVE